MTNNNSSIQALTDLINHAHSPFHCCTFTMNELAKAGFTRLELTKPFQIKPGGRYYINVFDTTCIAFTIGNSVSCTGEIPDFRMITSHTDWPTFLIKPNPEICSDQYGRLNAEPYGGAVYTSWLDRPLGIAGKVCLKGKDPFHPRTHLIDSGQPVALIPGLAIHMNHEINNGIKLNPQLHMLPLVSLNQKDDDKNFFLSYLCSLLDTSAEEILDYELCLYNADEGIPAGIHQEFFSSPRIDNCSSVHAALEAVINADRTGSTICMSAFYHNEEIGSTTKQGADSGLTAEILERIFENLGFNSEQLHCSVNSGLCLSLDVAHAAHPGYPDKNDLTNHVCLGDGVVLKLSARQSYATDSYYVSIVESICQKNQIPYTKYVNRSDLKGGNTLGSISSARLNIPCIDAGVPILSMHSARELMACEDQNALCRLAAALFTKKGELR